MQEWRSILFDAPREHLTHDSESSIEMLVPSGDA